MDGSELNAVMPRKAQSPSGEHVGHIKGMVFSPDPSIMDSSARPVFTAARRVMVRKSKTGSSSCLPTTTARSD